MKHIECDNHSTGCQMQAHGKPRCNGGICQEAERAMREHTSCPSTIIGSIVGCPQCGNDSVDLEGGCEDYCCPSRNYTLAQRGKK